MPTENHAKVRVLLKQQKAKIVHRCPFTIQLLYDSTDYTQPVSLGIDAGSRHIGVSATTETKVLYEADVTLRNDIVDLLSTRREARRTRRSRKTHYRKPRFNNRIRKDGWLAPSIQQKVDTHLTTVRKVTEGDTSSQQHHGRNCIIRYPENQEPGYIRYRLSTG